MPKGEGEEKAYGGIDDHDSDTLVGVGRCDKESNHGNNDVIALHDTIA
jgi:hypothetical protein